MIAALRAYDWPEVRGELDRLWQQIAERLRQRSIAAPSGLERGIAPRLFWQRDDVLIGHTCSRPYRLGQHRRFSVLGSLRFAIPGCEAGLYRSHIVARPGWRGDHNRQSGAVRVAVNSLCSQSGWTALEHWLSGQGLEPGGITLTGSHRISIARVAEGSADLAAIDAVSWHLATHFEPAARQVEVLDDSAPTPGLPLVTARRNTRLLPRLRDAISGATERARPGPRDALPIIGFAPASDRLYRLRPYNSMEGLKPLE